MVSIVATPKQEVFGFYLCKCHGILIVWAQDATVFTVAVFGYMPRDVLTE